MILTFTNYQVGRQPNMAKQQVFISKKDEPDKFTTPTNQGYSQATYLLPHNVYESAQERK